MDSQPLWTRQTLGQLAGLLHAPETGAVLAWDLAQRMSLWDTTGALRGEQALREVPAAAALSADGRWIVVSDRAGKLSWYDDRLTLQFEYPTEVTPLALAVETYGQYVLLSDRHRRGCLLTRLGMPVVEFETPRPLHHLAFLLAEASWIGCSDYGYLGCYNAQGQTRWRDKPLVNIGSFSTDGSTLAVLACYTEGLLLYDPLKGTGIPVIVPGTCRLARVTANGKLLFLLRDMPGQGNGSLSLLQCDGTVLGNLGVPASVAFLAAGPLGTTCIYGTSEGQIVKLAVKTPG